ncbi:hypothetical protein C8J30_101211 [Rhodobacter viridis]|uniref:Nickel/cobalt transporter regulator n=1 Tax=Rhodobacter viridis TaxID=1054202 RepID=A0A318U2Y4_9RHOB|nr:hypothetical protein [Rhodobacter viridis]PYF12830.1 hypothetical protein C8J30_101211 [Rhodobacter viridis]
MRAPLLLLCLTLPLPALAADLPLPPGATACKVMQSTQDTFCKFGNRWRLQTPRPPAFQFGDDFPVASQSMLIDLDRYDLPPVDGRWRYYLRDGIIYKVSAETGRVIGVVGPAHTN